MIEIGVWKTTENTVSGKYGVMRILDKPGGLQGEYHDSGFIYADRETAQRMADDLNGKEETACHGSMKTTDRCLQS